MCSEINRQTTQYFLYNRVRPISYIGEYSFTALAYRRIRYIGMRISADTECDNNQQ